MQHRISGLIIAALCALMLFTSCRHAEQVEPADVSDVMNNAAEDVLPLSEETPAAAKEPAAEPVALPESIDPLGFTEHNRRKVSPRIWQPRSTTQI